MLSDEMGTITALTVQKRHPDRVNVFLDGQFAFGLSNTVAADLRVGQTITAEQVDHLQQLDTIEAAKKAAYRFVSQRPRSIAEVKRKLGGNGYHESVVEQVVSKLESIDLLGDEKFGRYWIEQRETFKPRSRFALRQELQQKGVASDLIERLLSELDEEESARRAASARIHRFSKLPNEQFQKTMRAYLGRRGFDYGTAKLITDEMWQTVAELQTGDEAIKKET